jgi:hypothetical protein
LSRASAIGFLFSSPLEWSARTVHAGRVSK